jgi:hypothetical protein
MADEPTIADAPSFEADRPRRRRPGLLGPAVLGRVDLEAPGIKVSFPASSRSVALIVASLCLAFVTAIGLIFVAARAENVAAAGSWLERDKPPAAARAPAVTIFDGLDDEPIMAPPAARKSDPAARAGPVPEPAHPP